MTNDKDRVFGWTIDQWAYASTVITGFEPSAYGMLQLKKEWMRRFKVPPLEYSIEACRDFDYDWVFDTIKEIETKRFEVR